MEFIEKVSDLRGVLVIAYEEGLQLGRVVDIYIDKHAVRIKGISFKTGRLSIEKETYVGIENIRKMGKDVVIITQEAAATSLPKELEENGLKALKGIKITTHEGEHIGEFSDLIVTAEDGKISEILLAGNKVLDISAKEINIGADVIIVPADYADRIKECEQQPSGLLGRAIDPAAIGESVKETFKETVEKVTGKVGQIFKKSKPETKKIEEKTEPKKPETKKMEKPSTKSGPEWKPDDKRREKPSKDFSKSL